MADSSGRIEADVLGTSIRSHRLKAGLSREELAHLTQLSVRTISNIETGRVGRPHSHSLRRLADALHLTGVERDAVLQGAQRHTGTNGSATMLAQVVAAGRVDADLAAALDIVCSCGHLPPAVRIAAARLAVAFVAYELASAEAELGDLAHAVGHAERAVDIYQRLHVVDRLTQAQGLLEKLTARHSD